MPRKYGCTPHGIFPAKSCSRCARTRATRHRRNKGQPKRQVGCSAHGYFPARECSYCKDEWRRKSLGQKPKRLSCGHGPGVIARDCSICRAKYNKRYNDKKREERRKFAEETARIAEQETKGALDLGHKNDEKKTAPWNLLKPRDEAMPTWLEFQERLDQLRTPCFKRPGEFSDFNDPRYPDDPLEQLGKPFPSAQEAEELCEPCPLRNICLQFALRQREDLGVYGGKRIVGGRVYGEKGSAYA